MNNEELAKLKAENEKLKKINASLIHRVESGSLQLANPYSAFEHSVSLAEQVRERTVALNSALDKLNASHLQLKKANEKAEYANLSKTKFLAAVSHDLLQPLNAARLFSATLAEQSLTDKAHRLVDSLTQSLDDVESLLQTLVDISKLDAGVVQADIQVVSVSRMLVQLNAEFDEAAKRTGLKFKYRLCDAFVKSDPQLLIRMLRNLLTNAIRYTASGGILLSARKRGDTLLIQVWDTGQGISVEDQSIIFEEFKRIEQASDRTDRGLGLGLSIVDKIASVLGHNVSVRSTLGVGSVFSIELPLALNTTVYPDQGVLLPDITKPLTGLRLALVDNDAAICDAMSELVSQWGASMTTALDGESLLEKVNLSSVDMLMVDFHLDEETGIEFAERSTQSTSIPVLVITANYSRELVQQVNLAGYRLLNKPIKPLQLRQILQQLTVQRPI